MIVKLLTEHHLEFLSLKGGCRGSSESTLVRMSNVWKLYAAAQIILACFISASSQLCQRPCKQSSQTVRDKLRVWCIIAAELP